MLLCSKRIFDDTHFLEKLAVLRNNVRYSNKEVKIFAYSMIKKERISQSNIGYNRVFATLGGLHDWFHFYYLVPVDGCFSTNHVVSLRFAALILIMRFQ